MVWGSSGNINNKLYYFPDICDIGDRSIGHCHQTTFPPVRCQLSRTLLVGSATCR